MHLTAKQSRRRFSIGENISQAAQFVQTANAEAGIVALSLLKAPQLAGVRALRSIMTVSHQLDGSAVRCLEGLRQRA